MNDLLQLLSQDLFAKVVSSAGILAAAASLLATGLSVAANFGAARRKLRAAEEDTFRAALESDDLLTLGNYLSSKLGQFTVHEYSTTEQVAVRVDRMFARLGRFIGDPSEVQPAPPQPPFHAEQPREILPEEFARVRSDFEMGEIWNGLARLRRIIEMRLRAFGVARGFKERHLTSAGQALRLLAAREYVPQDAVLLLDFAIRVCNKGVHGYEVPQYQALEALSAAAQGLQLLQRH